MKKGIYHKLKQFRKTGSTFSFSHCFHIALLKWIMPTWDKDTFSKTDMLGNS